MNHISKLTYSNAAIGQQAAVLYDIQKSSKNIAIYERELTTLNTELDRVMAKAVAFKKSGPIEEIHAALQEHFEEQFQDCPSLLNDIIEQLRLFQNISGAESLRILFTTVKTNMCRRFHTDINSLRLLCTYVGPGTLWLPNEIVNHKAFLNRGGNKQIVLDETQIQQVETGDIIILKGALYPQANPIVHRSPTIEGHGESRLLLRIDTNDSINI